MANKHTPSRVDIPVWTILKIIGVVLALWFLWFVRDVIAIVFAALLLAALIEPFATWLQKYKVPRALGVVIVYAVLLLILGLAILLIVPPLVEQLTDLGKNLAVTLGSAQGAIDAVVETSRQYGLAEGFSGGLNQLQEGVSVAAGRVFTTLTGLFGGIATVLLVLVMALYIVVEEDSAKKLFRHFAPKKYQPYLIGLMNRMQDKLGAWLRGQLVLMVLVGLLTYIGLLIVGVEYALVLAIFAALAEIVPYAGPIVAAVPAILIAFTVSPLKALMVLVIYIVIQQLENNVLTPKIVQKSVGINPVVSLIVLLIGFKIGGLVGALLAIPVATICSVALRDLLSYYDKVRG